MYKKRAGIKIFNHLTENKSAASRQRNINEAKHEKKFYAIRVFTFVTFIELRRLQKNKTGSPLASRF